MGYSLLEVVIFVILGYFLLEVVNAWKNQLIRKPFFMHFLPLPWLQPQWQVPDQNHTSGWEVFFSVQARISCSVQVGWVHRTASVIYFSTKKQVCKPHLGDDMFCRGQRAADGNERWWSKQLGEGACHITNRSDSCNVPFPLQSLHESPHLCPRKGQTNFSVLGRVFNLKVLQDRDII